MLYLLLANGSHEEVDAAFSAAVEGEEFVCRDIFGDVVARYMRLEVTAYGLNQALRTPEPLGEARQVREMLKSAPLAYSPKQPPNLQRPAFLEA